MPWRPIETYQADWNTSDHTGRIAIKVDGRWNYVYQNDPAEFSAIVDLLRNEKPVFLATSSAGRRIVTGQEEIGEEES